MKIKGRKIATLVSKEFEDIELWYLMEDTPLRGGACITIYPSHGVPSKVIH